MINFFILFLRYGHVETVHHVADHLSQIREMQIRSKGDFNVGFSEFVPLSFVSKNSPMWKLQNDMYPQGPSAAHINKINQNNNIELIEKIDNDNENKNGCENDDFRPWIRSGPTQMEVIVTHAVSRLMLAGHIDNIQVRTLVTYMYLH